jgi:hypothetical protein
MGAALTKFMKKVKSKFHCIACDFNDKTVSFWGGNCYAGVLIMPAELLKP